MVISSPDCEPLTADYKLAWLWTYYLWLLARLIVNLLPLIISSPDCEPLTFDYWQVASSIDFLDDK